MSGSPAAGASRSPGASAAKIGAHAIKILPILPLVLLAACGSSGSGETSAEPSDLASAEPGNVNGATDGRSAPRAPPIARLVKQGRIEAGAECPVLHTPDGEVWALALGEADFGPGDYVRITGTRAEASFCQQGRGTIEPSRIDAIEPPARDRDPARAGGIAVTTEYVVGKWASKGGDCGNAAFAVTTNANGLALFEGKLNGRQETAPLSVGRNPSIRFDEPLPTPKVETRGPDGLAIIPAQNGQSFTLGEQRVSGDGAVFVKCP